MENETLSERRKEICVVLCVCVYCIYIPVLKRIVVYRNCLCVCVCACVCVYVYSMQICLKIADRSQYLNSPFAAGALLIESVLDGKRDEESCFEREKVTFPRTKLLQFYHLATCMDLHPHTHTHTNMYTVEPLSMRAH